MDALAKHNWDKLRKSIDEALHKGANPIAAFDADNTLWDTDMGEAFFQFLIDHKLVPLPEDPWDYYLKLRNGPNPPVGYLWLAQILAGVPVDTVLHWSEESAKKNPPPFFAEQKRLIDYLHSLNVQVYIVTASVKWAIDAPAAIYNIPSTHVIGIKTAIENNIVTANQSGPITWKQGKVEGLKLATNNKSPFLAAGNSSGDIHLLDEATHIKLAIRTVHPGHMIYDSEEELFTKAKAQGWLHHDFRIKY